MPDQPTHGTVNGACDLECIPTHLRSSGRAEQSQRQEPWLSTPLLCSYCRYGWFSEDEMLFIGAHLFSNSWYPDVPASTTRQSCFPRKYPRNFPSLVLAFNTEISGSPLRRTPLITRYGSTAMCARDPTANYSTPYILPWLLWRLTGRTLVPAMAGVSAPARLELLSCRLVFHTVSILGRERLPMGSGDCWCIFGPGGTCPKSTSYLEVKIVFFLGPQLLRSMRAIMICSLSSLFVIGMASCKGL